MIDDRKKFMTAQDVAELYHVTVRTVWRWRDAGRLHEAKRVGKSILFDRSEVESLGIAKADSVTLADVYMMLSAADTWERVWEIRDRIAATLSEQADERGTDAIRKSWGAAVAMAATHPDKEARGRWTDKAHSLGGFLGRKWGETDEAIAAYVGSYDDAKALMASAPHDPVYTIAHAKDGR